MRLAVKREHFPDHCQVRNSPSLPRIATMGAWQTTIGNITTGRIKPLTKCTAGTLSRLEAWIERSMD